MSNLSDLNLSKIENIWTKDKNYIIRHENYLLLKSLYIKTDKYTIGFHIKEKDFFFYVESKIDENKRLSILQDFNKKLHLYEKGNVVLKIFKNNENDRGLGSDTYYDEYECTDINMIRLFSSGSIELPNINKGILFITSPSNTKMTKIFRLFNVVEKKESSIDNQFSVLSCKSALVYINFKLNRKYKKKLGLIENSSQKS